MRLHTKYKKPKSKTSSKPSSKTRQTNKNSKVPKLRKDYRALTPCRAEKAELDITKMTFGFIDSHEVKYVKTVDGTIQLKDSWLELVLIMLNMVISENRSHYSDILCKYEITSQTFIVDKNYGVYTFDNNKKYKVYKIFDTGLYLESLLDNSDIFLAIVGLIKACGMALDEMDFGLVSKEYIERKLDFNKLADGEHIVGISDVASSVKSGMLLVEISIMGERLEIHDFNLLLYVFCKWIYENYGEGQLLKMPKHKGNGVSLNCDNPDVKYTQLIGSKFYIYSDLNTSGIIRFIKSAIEKLGISEDTIKFKFKSLKELEAKQPWLYEEPYKRKW